mgnify:CR=1 FL=1
MAKARKKGKLSAELRKRERDKPKRKKIALFLTLITVVVLAVMGYLTYGFVQSERAIGHYPFGLYGTSIGLVLLTGWLIYDWLR